MVLAAGDTPTAAAQAGASGSKDQSHDRPIVNAAPPEAVEAELASIPHIARTPAYKRNFKTLTPEQAAVGEAIRSRAIEKNMAPLALNLLMWSGEPHKQLKNEVHYNKEALKEAMRQATGVPQSWLLYRHQTMYLMCIF